MLLGLCIIHRCGAEKCKRRCRVGGWSKKSIRPSRSCSDPAEWRQCNRIRRAHRDDGRRSSDARVRRPAVTASATHRQARCSFTWRSARAGEQPGSASGRQCRVALGGMLVWHGRAPRAPGCLRQHLSLSHLGPGAARHTRPGPTAYSTCSGSPDLKSHHPGSLALERGPYTFSM